MFKQILAVTLALANTAFADGFMFKQKDTSTVQTVQKESTTTTLRPGVIVLRDGIDDYTASEFVEALGRTTSNEVTVYINSPGGSVISGARIVSTILASNKKITCVADFAASMAFIILQACDQRLVMDSSILMQHVPSGGAGGEFPNMFSLLELFKKITLNLDTMQAKRMGKRVEDFQKAIRDDMWVPGFEATERKVADRSSGFECSQELLNTTTWKTFRTMFGEIRAEFSNCPLVTTPKTINFGRITDDKFMVQFERSFDYKNNFVNRQENFYGH